MNDFFYFAIDNELRRQPFDGLLFSGFTTTVALLPPGVTGIGLGFEESVDPAAPVPEPNTVVLFLIGLGGLIFVGGRRQLEGRLTLRMQDSAC